LKNKVTQNIEETEKKLVSSSIRFEQLQLLKNKRTQYYRMRPLKWFTTAVGVLIGILLGLLIPKVVNKLHSSQYQRVTLDLLMDEKLGHARLQDIFTKEILAVSYEYNGQEPRLYSKYFLESDPAVYDTQIGNITGASSSAPTYFEPKSFVNGYGFDELQIDGGVICNNPAFYAWSIQRFLYGTDKMRMISIGTGA
jgi:hypothetical protein